MSLLTDEVEVLRRSPMFAGVETPQLKLLAYTGEMVRFDAGKFCFDRESPATALM